MSDEVLTEERCAQRFLINPSQTASPAVPVRKRWHLRGKCAVKAYVESLAHELHEWLLALFIDDHLNLLGVCTVARGDVGSCRVNFDYIFRQGYGLKAAGFILVHNHPSGDPQPSRDDMLATIRLSRIAADCEMPLLEHLIIAKGGMRSVGGL